MTEAIDRLELSERSVYAFVGWITSIFMYICFIIWAFVPDSYLISVGIEYYPPKNLALTVPSYLLICGVAIVIGYIGLNLVRTPDPEDIVTMCTPHGDKSPSHHVKCGRREGIPKIGEMDPGARSYFIATNGGRRRQQGHR